MGMNSTLEDLRRVIKICHEEWKWILIICEFAFGIWRALACPLHCECTLTLLVSQFRERFSSKLAMWEAIQTSVVVSDPSLLPFSQFPVPCANLQNRDLLDCFMCQFADSNELNDSREFFGYMVLNFVITGRDISSVALAWFFWLLSFHRHVEEKIVQELSGIFSRRPDSKK